jgi:hypothetical protein
MSLDEIIEGLNTESSAPPTARLEDLPAYRRRRSWQDGREII